jgi:Skp family chaperone for outer membrane proteins
MKNIFFTLMVFMVAGVSAAADAAPPSRAIVDMQALLSASTAGQSIQAQVDEHRTMTMKTLATKQGDLRQREQDLMSKRGSVSGADLVQAKQSLEQDFEKMRNYTQERKTVLDVAYNKAMMSLMDQVYGVVKDIANEHGYGTVLSKHSVVYDADAVDISTEAMKRLNAQVSDIKLDVK